MLGWSALWISFLSIDAQASSQAAAPLEIVAETYYNTFSRAHPARAHPSRRDGRTKTIDASGRTNTGSVRSPAIR